MSIPATVVVDLRSKEGNGAKQTLVIELVREERRGLAASLNTVAMRLPLSVGPSAAGYLLSLGMFAGPFTTLRRFIGHT